MMNQQISKRVTGSTLSQHYGKSVILLGEFVQLEPNGQVFTLRTSSSDVVTVQLQEPFNCFKMRALTIRPDDADLFCHFATPEQYGFFLTHLSAFKRMWEAEGKVYWLRFLLCLKDTLEHTLENKPEFEFMYDIENLEQLQSLIFINIHKKFVQSTYSVTKSFMEQVFVLTKNLTNLKEQTRMKNPFYTKETREAFRELLGKPEVDEDIPFVPVAYMAAIYGFFVGSVCTLLKRWLKEPDLSEEAKKKVDYTHFYWKPHSEWTEDYYWPTCFDEYLADTYGTELPKMLLTSNIHEIFLSQESHSPCVSNRGDINIFELLRDIDEDEDDDEEEEIDDNEPFLMNQMGYLQPKVQNCAVHSDCYKKVLHDSKCSQPYLCKGSDLCRVTCENTQKNMHTNVQPATVWKKMTCETFACKGSSGKRHVSTLACSHNTQIETFVHITESLDSSEICKHLQETIQAEMDFDFATNPEFLNIFNQQKRKEDVKNRLRNKFNQKYCSIPQEFNDPDFRQGLFRDAQKLYINNKLSEELNVPIFSNNQRHKKWVYVPGSVLNSLKNAETTIALGTHSIVTGRIVTSTSSKACSPTPVCTNINPEPLIAIPNDSKPKSKKSKKKKKGNASNENKDAPASNPNNSATPSTTTQQNSCNQPSKSTNPSDTKENPAQLPEKLIAVPTESKPKTEKKKKGNPSNESKDASALSTNNIAIPSTQQNSCNQPSLYTDPPVTKENPVQLPESITAVPSESKSKSKKKKKVNTSNEDKDAPALSTNSIATSQQCSLSLPNPPTHQPSAFDALSTSKDSQAIVKNPTSIIESACGKSIKRNDKSQDKRQPLTVEKSKDAKDAFPDSSHATGDAVAGESQSSEDALTGGSESTGDAVAGESESTRDAAAGKSESTGDAVAAESGSTEDSVARGSKSTIDVVAGESKSTEDIAEDNGQFCFGGCIPTSKTGHKCNKEQCSLKACCSDCAFVEKNASIPTDSKLGSAAVITKKPKKMSDSEVDGTEEALVINKNNKQLIEQTKSGTVDLNAETANQNSSEKPAAEQKLKDDSSGDSALNQNEKKAVDNEIPKDLMSVSHDNTLNPSLDTKQVVIKEQLEDSSPDITVDTVYQNEAEKVLEDNQLTENSFDLKDKIIKENGVECQTENVCDISDAVALEAQAAISNLKFESKEDKPVEDFLTLIGVLKDNSSAISEIKSSSDASLTNAKGDSGVQNKKLKFKTCAFCSKKEVTAKTFKRCAKCKAENLAVQRYYCSRECQIDDWQESHRDEHLKNLL